MLFGGRNLSFGLTRNTEVFDSLVFSSLFFNSVTVYLDLGIHWGGGGGGGLCPSIQK